MGLGILAELMINTYTSDTGHNVIQSILIVILFHTLLFVPLIFIYLLVENNKIEGTIYPSMSQSTKQEILEKATDLLRFRSYNSFSYRDISEYVGIKKASIHYHFPTKDVLGVAAVRNYRSKIEYLTEKLAKNVEDPLDKIEAYFQFFKKGVDKGLLCPAGVLSVEFNTLNKEMQEELISLFNFYREWLIDILKDGKARGEFTYQQDPEDLAMLFISTIEGATIYARAYDTPALFDRITTQLKTML